jgi:hypothetical protein
MVAQCFRFAYVKLAILARVSMERLERVPKWNREREKAHDEEGVVVATGGWSGGDGILRNASVRLARNGEMC